MACSFNLPIVRSLDPDVSIRPRGASPFLGTPSSHGADRDMLPYHPRNERHGPAVGDLLCYQRKLAAVGLLATSYVSHPSSWLTAGVL